MLLNHPPKQRRPGTQQERRTSSATSRRRRSSSPTGTSAAPPLRSALGTCSSALPRASASALLGPRAGPPLWWRPAGTVASRASARAALCGVGAAAGAVVAGAAAGAHGPATLAAHVVGCAAADPPLAAGAAALSGRSEPGDAAASWRGGTADAAGLTMGATAARPGGTGGGAAPGGCRRSVPEARAAPASASSERRPALVAMEASVSRDSAEQSLSDASDEQRLYVPLPGGGVGGDAERPFAATTPDGSPVLGVALAPALAAGAWACLGAAFRAALPATCQPPSPGSPARSGAAGAAAAPGGAAVGAEAGACSAGAGLAGRAGLPLGAACSAGTCTHHATLALCPKEKC